MITTLMEKELQNRKELFIAEVLFIADAEESTTMACGWAARGKVEWLKSAVATYRKDLRRILKD